MPSYGAKEPSESQYRANSPALFGGFLQSYAPPTGTKAVT